MATTTGTGFKVQCPSCEASVSIKSEALRRQKSRLPEVQVSLRRRGAWRPRGRSRCKGKKSAQGGGTAVLKKAPTKNKAKDRDDDADDAPPKKKSNTILFVGVGLVVLTLGVLAAAYFGGLFGGDDPPAGGGGTGGKTVAGGSTTPGSSPALPDRKDPALPAGVPGIVRDPTNLLPNDAQWVLDVDVPKAAGTPAGNTLFAADKKIAGLVRECLGFGVNDIERVVASGGGDGAWSFSIVRTRSGINHEALKNAMELGDPLGTIKNREYFSAKDNPLFDAIGNYFATRLREFTFRLDPPAGPREMTVCQLDGRTLAVADRHIMEKFLETDAQPDFRSRLTTAPRTPPPDAAGPGGPMPGR